MFHQQRMHAVLKVEETLVTGDEGTLYSQSAERFLIVHRVAHFVF